jgi:uncharacterized alkaline shock family protein YloU
MSDVMNGIFTRAQSETSSSEDYGYGTTEAEAPEPAGDTTETEDTAAETGETADAAEAEEHDTDEAVAEEDTDAADEAAEETEEVPVVVAAAEPATEPEEAGTRPAAGTRGSTTVADGVVTKIVTMVARKAEGVHELDEAGTSVDVDGEVATIAVTLVVVYGHPVKKLAEQLRIDVIEAVEDYLGLDVALVDVHIADIHVPDAG